MTGRGHCSFALMWQHQEQRVGWHCFALGYADDGADGGL